MKVSATAVVPTPHYQHLNTIGRATSTQKYHCSTNKFVVWETSTVLIFRSNQCAQWILPRPMFDILLVCVKRNFTNLQSTLTHSRIHLNEVLEGTSPLKLLPRNMRTNSEQKRKESLKDLCVSSSRGGVPLPL